MASLFAEAEDEEEQEAGEHASAGSAAEAVQGHVQVIAAMQQVQASQAGYSADPALQAHRPKLRDKRCEGMPCATMFRPIVLLTASSLAPAVFKTIHRVVHLAIIMAIAASPLCCW